jgi:nucleotide-binding universal stress UspA family protein
MERSPQTMVHAVEANTLADILERVLDKGIVIAGDIKIKLVDVELLTIQIRLLIASVERAKEMGIDWWESSPFLSSKAKGNGEQKELINALKQRIERLENNVIRSPEEVE